MVFWLLLGLFIGFPIGIVLGGMAIKLQVIRQLQASRQLIDMLTKQNGVKHDVR